MTTTTLCTIPEARSASARASYATAAKPATSTTPANWLAAIGTDPMFVRHNGTDQPGGPGGSS